MKKLTTVGQEVYATLMLVALLIDIALAVLIFSHGVGWGIAYLITGTWIFFLVAHRLAVLASAPFSLPEDRGGSTARGTARVPPVPTPAPRIDPDPHLDVAEPHVPVNGYPWGAGWWERIDREHEDGAITTGAYGLTFLCEYDDPSVQRQWEYSWDRVHSAVATRVEDLPALAAHPGLARDIRDYAIAVVCDDPFVGPAGSHTLVILTSKAHPLQAWKSLFADQGVDLVGPVTEPHADDSDIESAMPEDPRPATWAVPSAGLRKPVPSAAPGWWQSPDGSWNPPGDRSPP